MLRASMVYLYQNLGSFASPAPLRVYPTFEFCCDVLDHASNDQGMTTELRLKFNIAMEKAECGEDLQIHAMQLSSKSRIPNIARPWRWNTLMAIQGCQSTHAALDSKRAHHI